ncbi:MAG TPA: GNAT family N-acetyltransferase [Ktedonobacteraceae bacterium]|nr:GNAT family N-acetyltransferase [Ktedonobacteraceae bacterium]
MVNQPIDKSPFTLSPFTASSPYLEDVVWLYTETWPSDPDEIRSFISRYATYPDFRGQVALVENKVIGMGFGHRSRPGDWWHNRIAALLGTDHPALQDAWVLVELAVLEVYRGEGIGTALHNTLLQNQPCPRALLSTEVKNTRARRFYERFGWQYLHNNFKFREDDEPFVIMSRECS